MRGWTEVVGGAVVGITVTLFFGSLLALFGGLAAARYVENPSLAAVVAVVTAGFFVGKFGARAGRRCARDLSPGSRLGARWGPPLLLTACAAALLAGIRPVSSTDWGLFLNGIFRAALLPFSMGALAAAIPPDEPAQG